MGLVKQENRSSILNVLKTKGMMSRKDIASIINLTPAAVTILVNEMIENGVIKEVGELEEEDKRAGRKKIMIDINYDYKYVLGISIDAEYINIGIIKINGEIISELSWETNVNDKIDPEEFLNIIANKCVKLFWEKNLNKENILGAGVGIVGLVDKNTGISNHAYGLWKSKVRVKEILEKALDLPVVVDNNVRSLAIAEMDYKAEEDIHDMLFVKHGPGVGSAMIVGKEIYYGANNKAGEIGHTIGKINGHLCRCGKKGCLESIISKHAILKSINCIFSETNTPKLYSLCDGNIHTISLEKILESSFSGDEEVRKIVKRVAVYMALGISNAVSLYDSQKVILYGEIFKFEKFFKEFKYIIKDMLLTENVDEFINISKLDYKKNYIGGATLAIREFFYKTGGAL